MKIKIAKIIILTIALIIFLGGFWHFCHAEQKLLINYPDIKGAIKPGEAPEGSELPNLIKYLYMFSLGIVGIIALLSMLIGAVKYILSAGNASKAGDAKDQIYSAILGIILLLASVIILRTINPDLVKIGFEIPSILGEPEGPEDQHVACHCVWGSEPTSDTTFQTGRCYLVLENCTAPCVNLCTPGGYTAICKPNDTKHCP